MPRLRTVADVVPCTHLEDNTGKHDVSALKRQGERRAVGTVICHDTYLVRILTLVHFLRGNSATEGLNHQRCHVLCPFPGLSEEQVHTATHLHSCRRARYLRGQCCQQPGDDVNEARKERTRLRTQATIERTQPSDKLAEYHEVRGNKARRVDDRADDPGPL